MLSIAHQTAHQRDYYTKNSHCTRERDSAHYPPNASERTSYRDLFVRVEVVPRRLGIAKVTAAQTINCSTSYLHVTDNDEHDVTHSHALVRSLSHQVQVVQQTRARDAVLSRRIIPHQRDSDAEQRTPNDIK